MVRTVGVFFMVGAFAVGCASAPKGEAKRHQLEAKADETLQIMIADDPGVQTLIDQSAGYVVFPEIKAGGFVVGGAGGEGVVYENGRPTAFAELSQASFGAQIGGQKYAEVVIIRDKYRLDAMKAGTFDFGGQASAVILKKGVATATQFNEKGLAVVVDPIGGAMVNASVSGQQIKIVM